MYGGDASDHVLSLSGLIPANGPGKNSDSILLLDLVATWEPMENLSAWLNFDYQDFGNAGGGLSGVDIWAIALSSRYAINDTTGIALRNEFVKIRDLNGGVLGVATLEHDVSLHTITGTLDHALTDNLTLKLEGRYDNYDVQSGGQDFFFVNGNDLKDRNQFLMIAQAMYRF